MKTIEHSNVDALISNWRARDRHIDQIGFVKVTEELCAYLAGFGPWVEIGSGSGALARGIVDIGGRCLATDNFDWHDTGRSVRKCLWGKSGIIRADAERVSRLLSRHPSIGLLSSWPDYDKDWCYRAVRHLRPGQLFAYIGEGAGGCTGDDQLHDLLEAEFEEVGGMAVHHWIDGIYDHLIVYRRREPLLLEAPA